VPLLSIVVPIYRVQGYLRECLDSILNQPFTDLEVIAVDDCSPDGSGQILAEYAARDTRVRVVSLERNVGLGPARNIGLERACGEYVWFVDSDDWLAPGALRAVVRRLRETSPDVLIVNHARVNWNPRRKPWVGGDLHARAPETFTLAEWPAAIDILHVAWNKVVRREFLLGLGLQFAPGWYEDVSFTYPLLLAAERISTLDRLCINYRQRRHGAITRTVGDGHFEMFDQWERVFAGLDESHLEAAEQLRPQLFVRMIWHYLMVLGNQNRVPRALRRRFFARIVEHYQRYLPPGGHPQPEGSEGRKYQLVARGDYRTYAALRTMNRRIEGGWRLVRWVGRPVKRGAKAVARRGREALRRAYYRVQLRLPADESLAVFTAYWNRGYACNPAAIYEKMRELAPSVRGVWVVRRNQVKTMPPGVDYVVSGSLPYYRALARAHWLINNVNYPDFVVKRPGSVHVMTHHGTPLKVMGLDEHRYPARAAETGPNAQDLGALLRRCDRWDFSIAANAFSTEVWERSYPCGFSSLETGYPRNDRLATATDADVAQARASLGIAPGQTAVLYAPTHREYDPEYRSLLDAEQLAEELGPDAVVLVRAHYFYVTADASSESGSAGRVLDVSAHPSIETLSLAADVLITDYSSLMFDYAVLDRPIVIFAPDWEAYRTIRGVNFDLLAEPPGAVATTYRDLADLFATGAYGDDAATKARAHFRARFCALEDGGAAERVVRRVFLGDPPVSAYRNEEVGNEVGIEDAPIAEAGADETGVDEMRDPKD
jgi:CDP-glycerol glycerophosphotransferase